MGICNYCRLNRIKKDAENGLKVTILSDAVWGLGGKNVYVHPKEIKISSLSDGERSKYRKAWMKEIPKQCFC